MALLVTGVRFQARDSLAAPAVAAHLGVNVQKVLEATVVRLSMDARSRPPTLLANLKVRLPPQDEASILAAAPAGVRAFTPRDAQRAALPGAWHIHARRWPRGRRPIVVGAGPAGLFAAMRLAEAGAMPLLLERGAPVEQRRSQVARYWSRGALDEESNVAYGEGGAGAFSDGKLHTRSKDGRAGYVLSRLVQAGADPSILIDTHAHIGTDRLRQVIARFREALLELGAQLRFGARVTGLLVDAQRCVGVRLASGEEIEAPAVVLATGQAAQDSARAFLEAGMQGSVRPFAVGARIEHPRSLVDRARHGAFSASLPAASYRLVAPRGDAARQGYTFCMCPGGLVIPSSERCGQVVVNGMSFSHRNARWSNSAVVVPVGPQDFGSQQPLAGFAFRDELERRAWRMGGGEFRAPAQRVSDLLAGRASQDLPRTSHPLGVTPCDLAELLPRPVIEGMIAAIVAFDAKLDGFAGPEAVLIAPETRTASPIRFARDERYEAQGLAGAYPAGEGLGWGGGIVSAAMDGVRVAEAVEAACSAPSASSP